MQKIITIILEDSQYKKYYKCVILLINVLY